ncbi:MAG TPA: GNAT family protein [Anaerolineae bacterium]|nr:GNAT family protein [Anaerolineae bacterium]
MNAQLFIGERVRLAAFNPERDAEVVARWSRDSEYWRLITSDPSRPRLAARVKEDLAKTSPDENYFAIHTLGDDRLIGDVGLWIPSWIHADAWVGIAIGERDYWGRGYGTDAMRVILRYAFTELNLHRVSLSVLASNARALRSYAKAGFTLEGRARHISRWDGEWYDDVYMGILRNEWRAITNY